MLERAADLIHLDVSPEHRQPLPGRVVVATMAAVIASLAVDALLVAIGEALFPKTTGYVHFRFADYAKLTVIGVVVAGAAWPVVTRITSTPRWLYLRLAVLVTLILWLPDLYILYKGQPADAVAVLMVMHLAIAFITYNLMVRVAPIRRPRRVRRLEGASSTTAAGSRPPPGDGPGA